MIILVPFFGDRARVRPLLDRWIEAYKRSGTRAPWYALSDSPETYDLPSARVDPSEYAEAVRPGQPFDVKGALVCAAIRKYPEPLLVLDADAFLARDPRDTLALFWDAPIAMPRDHGALMHDRLPRLSAPYAGVPKLCAGVQWFGAATEHARVGLAAGYRRAHAELLALPRLPWSPPLAHLVEQYAWTLAASRAGGKVLPVTMNWAPHFLGRSEHAVVNHHFGVRKWATTPGRSPG